MNLGDAFLMRIPGHQHHLWFVISDPTAHAAFIIVNVTSDAERTGKECALLPGDHKWITKECYINFADALEITPEKAIFIQTLLGKGCIKMEAPLDGVVLRRIIAAAKKSKALQIAFKKYLP